MSLDSFISESEQSSLRAMKRTEGWPILVKLLRGKCDAAHKNLAGFTTGDEALYRKGYVNALDSLLEDILSLHILTAEVDSNVRPDRYGYDPREGRVEGNGSAGNQGDRY